MPVIGDPTAVRFNIVPRDFVVSAIATLSGLDGSSGRTYQLADPHPLTVDELYRAITTATERRMVRIPLTRSIAKFAIDRVPGVYGTMRIPSSAVDYLTHPTHYLTGNQADLAGSGVACSPRLPEYLPALVRFMKANPTISSAAML